MPLTFAETPLYYKDSQGQYHRVLSGADMTGYRTASAQDAIDTAQDADIASRAKTDEIGIVITGSRPSMAVSPGQYVIVRGSTITGVTDGLYINSSSGDLSTSTDVTAADLTAVTGGGLNEINANVSKLISKVPTNSFSSTAAAVMGNFIANYGCSCFLPLAGASDYTIALTSVSVYGMSGDKKADFSVTARYKTGFVVNSSVDYSGKYISATYAATIQ